MHFSLLHTGFPSSIDIAPLGQIFAQVAGQGAAGFEMSDGIMKMMGSFTVLRLVNLLGAAGLNMTKEQLLELNAQLNQIKKPE